MKTQAVRTIAEERKEYPLSKSFNIALSELSEKTDGAEGMIAVNGYGDVTGYYNTTGMVYDGLKNN